MLRIESSKRHIHKDRRLYRSTPLQGCYERESDNVFVSSRPLWFNLPVLVDDRQSVVSVDRELSEVRNPILSTGTPPLPRALPVVSVCYDSYQWTMNIAPEGL